MPASEAGAWLERFAASAAPDNVCTPEGRATLRGAVRAYGRAMAEGGQVWPNIAAIGQEPNAITAVEASVMIAAASGLVEVSDLRGPARGLVLQTGLAHWPAVRDLHVAARVACGDLVNLQQTASRFVLERERYKILAERAQRRRDARAAEQLHRQAERMQRSMVEIEMLTERLAERVEQSRNAS